MFRLLGKKEENIISMSLRGSLSESLSTVGYRVPRLFSVMTLITEDYTFDTKVSVTPVLHLSSLCLYTSDLWHRVIPWHGLESIHWQERYSNHILFSFETYGGSDLTSPLRRGREGSRGYIHLPPFPHTGRGPPLGDSRINTDCYTRRGTLQFGVERTMGTSICKDTRTCIQHYRRERWTCRSPWITSCSGWSGLPCWKCFTGSTI